MPHLDDRATATVLAALRYWQEHVSDQDKAELADADNGFSHFTEHPPLTNSEIDDLIKNILNGEDFPEVFTLTMDDVYTVAELLHQAYDDDEALAGNHFGDPNEPEDWCPDKAWLDAHKDDIVTRFGDRMDAWAGHLVDVICAIHDQEVEDAAKTV